jgi:hypothetical protein
MPSPGDDQMPQSLASSQTVVGTSVDPGTGYRTSFKRKRDNSPSDFARNLQPFVAGSDGDSLPHYLTVSPAVPWLFSHIECEYRFLKVGNQFCSKSGVCLACFGKPTVDRQGYTWGVLWELVRIHCLHSNQGITPKACRNLMGKNAIVGPNVKEIILETRLEECPISDLGKAEHDAQVREFILDCVFLWANGHKSPWEHLDSEESLPDGNSFSPLKFGGHVEFVVRVTESLDLQQQHPSSVLHQDLAGDLVQFLCEAHLLKGSTGKIEEAARWSPQLCSTTNCHYWEGLSGLLHKGLKCLLCPDK